MTILNQIVIFLYPLLCIFVPCMVYQLICYKRNTPLSYKTNKWNLLWRYILMFYLYLVMRAVGMGSVWDIGHYDSLFRMDEINLVPFQSHGSITYILNVIMLMPLGFLLPFIWKGYRKIHRTIFAGFLLSLTIEIGQLFNFRVTDIDDLMMNTLGALFGFCIWFILDKLFKLKPRDTYIFHDEPLAYVLLTVAGTFFLFSWRFLFPNVRIQ